MKKIALLLVAALSIAMLSACTGGKDSVSDSGASAQDNSAAQSALPQLEPMDAGDVFTLRNRITGKTISIGDGMEQANEVTGGKQMDVTTYTDGVERCNYYDAEFLYLDNLDGQVVSWYFKDTSWEVNTGAHIGMTKAQIEELYKDYPNLHKTEDNEWLIAFNKEKQPIPYSDDAYYILDISFDETDLVYYIGMRTKIAREKMQQNQSGTSATAQSGEDQTPAQSSGEAL